MSSSSEYGVLEWVVSIALLLLSFGVLIALRRLVHGPTLPDRVVALDLCAVQVVGMIALLSVVQGVPALIDVALVVALVAFLGTVAFARYLEKRV